MLTARSAAPMVVTLVLNHMDIELDDTEWVINRLKADILSESAIDGIYILYIFEIYPLIFVKFNIAKP